MSNPILTVFDDAGNAIPIPAFPLVTEGGGGGESGGGGFPSVMGVIGVCADDAYVGVYTNTGSMVIE